MKKSLALAIMLAGGASLATADISLHGVDFTTWGGTAMQNYAGQDIELLATQNAWGQLTDTTKLASLYMVNGSGYKNNHASSIYLTHLCIEGTTPKTVNYNGGSAGSNELKWNSNTTYGFTIANGGWIDINANYSSETRLFQLANMQTGDVYLNATGQIASSMHSSFAGTIHAALNKSNEPVLVTRTLISGDFSSVDLSAYNFDFGWYKLDTTGNLATLTSSADLTTLTSLAGHYAVYGDTDGLKVAYVSIPEPATATLSLLALAGLAARRRRK